MTTRIFTKLDIKHSMVEVSVYGLPPAEARRLKSSIDEEISAIIKAHTEERRSCDYECRTIQENGAKNVYRIQCGSE